MMVNELSAKEMQDVPRMLAFAGGKRERGKVFFSKGEYAQAQGF